MIEVRARVGDSVGAPGIVLALPEVSARVDSERGDPRDCRVESLAVRVWVWLKERVKGDGLGVMVMVRADVKGER